MLSTVDPDVLASALARIERAARRPGPPLAAADPTLPVQSLVVGAQDFRHDTAVRAGKEALLLLQGFAADSVVLARALRLPGWESLPTEPARVDELLARLESGDRNLAARWPEAAIAHQVYHRVVRSLSRAPVQDLRIDFHDLLRPDDEIDADAGAVAEALARGMENGTLSPRIGVRTGPLRPGTAPRTLRTLDLVVSTLADRVGGQLPEGFLLSIPGVGSPDTVGALVHVLAHLEQRCGLRKGSLKLELGIDRADTILDRDGRVRVSELVDAARGRCAVLRVDTEALASAAGPGVASLVRDLVHLATAGTGVLVSAGASPKLEVEGEHGSAARRAERFAEVHGAWRSHTAGVLEHLQAGTSWGWDLSVAQIPARLAAVVAHARMRLGDAVFQLERTLEQALSEDPVGQDLTADGQARLEVLLRWLDCGAIDVEELGSGLDDVDVRGRSFRQMVDRRRS